MSAAQSSGVPGAVPSALSHKTADPVEQVWVALLGDDADAARFARAWLSLQCSVVPRCRAGFLLLAFTPQTAPLTEAWPDTAAPAGELMRLAERAIRERRPSIAWAHARDASGQPILELQAAYPITVDQVSGAVAVAVAMPRGIDAADPHELFQQLRWGTGWLAARLAREQRASADATIARASLALDLVAAASEQLTRHASATVAVNELAVRLKCDRVSLGVAQRGRVKLLVMSHAASFLQNSPLVQAIESAMEECLFRRTPVAYPPLPDTAGGMPIAHRDLAAETAARGAVMSVPLMGPAATPVGVLTLERHGGADFEAQTLILSEATASLIGIVLHFQSREARWVAGRVPTAIGRAVHAVTGPHHPTLKLGLAAAVMAMLGLSLATGTFRVTAKTVLEGEVQRAAVAPFDGFIAKAPARPGDQVSQGVELATLDDRDLLLDRARAQADMERSSQKYREALAKHDRPAAASASAQMEQAQAQLALTQSKLERSRITAPFDGIIVHGDLTQMLGSPIEKGKVLFEIAPLSNYRLALQVDERDIGHVLAGQEGSLLLTGMPMQNLPFTITRVTPIASTEEGRNFFRVEARLAPDAEAALRPGMEGIAKVNIRSRSLIWIWTHDLVDWLRLAAWRWLP
jgi:multidrug efflux pump subunit AcrA (membrane-fusion protein)